MSLANGLTAARGAPTEARPVADASSTWSGGQSPSGASSVPVTTGLNAATL